MYLWITVTFFGALASFLYWWLEKRKFERFSSLGVEQFNNYHHKIYTSLIDKLIWWSCIISLFMACSILISSIEPSLISMMIFYSVIYDLLKPKKHA